MTPRRMYTTDLGGVEALYALCHPVWPSRAPAWYLATNTLVLHDQGHLIGMTSGSVTVPPSLELARQGEWVMYGHDVCVHPDYRGKGYGMMLATARMQLGRQAGCQTFIGATWTGNAAMRAILEHLGCRAWSDPVPGIYPWHDPPDDAGVIYIGRL